jgi:hypothetical protein
MQNREEPALLGVIVDAGRWNGLSRPITENLLLEGAPPARLLADIREIRQADRRDGPMPPAAVARERTVLCRYVTQLESQVFYTPVPGQFADDERWAVSHRGLLRWRPAEDAEP